MYFASDYQNSHCINKHINAKNTEHSFLFLRIAKYLMVDKKHIQALGEMKYQDQA